MVWHGPLAGTRYGVTRYRKGSRLIRLSAVSGTWVPLTARHPVPRTRCPRGSVMFGSIGMPELIIILVIALIIFGPRKLPELGKSLGRSLNEFKRASTDLQNTLEQEIKLEEQKDRQKEKEQEFRDRDRFTPSDTIADGTGTTGSGTPVSRD